MKRGLGYFKTEVDLLYFLHPILPTLRIKVSGLSLASSLSSSSTLFMGYRESASVLDSVNNISVLPIPGS